MKRPPYKSPVLPPASELAKVTAEYKRVNDERAARMAAASARPVSPASAGLDEMAEAARCELLTQCAIAERADQEGEDDDLRLRFYAGFREACAEFFHALGARRLVARDNHLDAMHEAIASLDRYRGEGGR